MCVMFVWCSYPVDKQHFSVPGCRAFTGSPSTNPTALLGSYQPTGRSCFPWCIVASSSSVLSHLRYHHTDADHHGVDVPIFNEDLAPRPAVAIYATTLDGGRLSKGSG
jgi:hypothetical protein